MFKHLDSLYTLFSISMLTCFATYIAKGHWFLKSLWALEAYTFLSVCTVHAWGPENATRYTLTTHQKDPKSQSTSWFICTWSADSPIFYPPTLAPNNKPTMVEWPFINANDKGVRWNISCVVILTSALPVSKAAAAWACPVQAATCRGAAPVEVLQ